MIMKLNITILMVCLSISLLSCTHTVNAQDDVPEAVETTFKAMYPDENDPDWEMDAHGNWEARIRIKGIRNRVDYRPDGRWVETEISIDKEELPKVIKDIINASKELKDMKITEVEKVDSATKGKFYDVEFKQKGKNKDVEFRESGEIIN